MIEFWMIVAGLTLLALIFIVPPLLRKNTATEVDRNSLNVAIYQERLAELKRENLTPEQLAQAKQELDKNLAQDLEERASAPVAQLPNCWVAIGLTLFLPVLAVGGYVQLGSPHLFLATTGSSVVHAANGSQADNVEMNQAIIGLEARLKEQPDDLKGWQLLARSYVATGDSAKAIEIYNKILTKFGQNPQILTDFADLLAQANEGQFTGLPQILLKKALSLEPNHQKGLFLAGLAAREDSDYQMAITYWERLLTQLPPEAAEIKTNLEQYITSARQQLENPPSETKPAAPANSLTVTPATDTTTQIEVQVKLAPALQEHIKPNDTLFIYARATKGSPMPLAIVKKAARDLPISAILNDSMAMMPTMKLSNFKEVAILARISTSGLATEQAGDLKGEVSPVKLGEQDKVEVTINQIVP
jgi:cytochrome c-type biogenesis protein CcmH